MLSEVYTFDIFVVHIVVNDVDVILRQGEVCDSDNVFIFLIEKLPIISYNIS